MKKSIVVLFIMVFVSSVVADNYMITRMNTQSIKIGHRICKVGDVFSDGSVIFWNKDKQAFKAKNMKTGKERVFVEPEFRNKKCKSIKDYFLKNNLLSTRGVHNLNELSEALSENAFFLLDTICIESPIPMNNTDQYYIVYEVDGKVLKNTLRNERNHFVIDRSLLQIDDNINELILSVYFKREGIDEDYHLTDSMKISIIPISLWE